MDAAQLHAVIRRGNMPALQHALSILGGPPSSPSSSPPASTPSGKERNKAGSGVITALHEGRGALHAAVANPAAVSLLLEAGAPHDAREASRGQTPLHLAMRGGHVSSAQLLLNSGASLDARDRLGESPADILAEHLSDVAAVATSGLCYAWGSGHNYQLGIVSANKYIIQTLGILFEPLCARAVDPICLQIRAMT